WHSDGRHAQLRFVKIAFYLDPVDASTGALRVIPGSHHVGDSYGDGAVAALVPWVGAESDENEETAMAHWQSAPERMFGLPGSKLPAVALESSPGDVVAFNHNLLHSSWGGSSRRRMFTINLCERATDDLIPELRAYIASYARFWIDSVIGPAMLVHAG